MAEASARLKRDPGLLSGDPARMFTYEDPVLAAALYTIRSSQQVAAKLYGAAGSRPGEKLKEGWFRPAWIRTGMRAIFSKLAHNRVELGGMTPNSKIAHKQSKLRLIVCGDAGFKGVAQDKVITMMLKRHRAEAFDMAIHLGDVYFAGEAEEMAFNFLEPFARLTKAEVKLFTLVGNHDLY